MTGGGTPPARLEQKPEEASTVLVSASQEPPEQEASTAPVSTPVHLHRLSVQLRRRCRRRATPVHLQRETPGPCAARPEVRGPRVARPRAPGPRSAQQGLPEAVPVCRENLQEKDRQITVAEPPGQSETKTPARGQ